MNYRAAIQLALAVLLASATLSAQQLVLLPGESLAFDYSDTELVTAQVSKFQAQWDNAATWADIPATGGFRDVQTQVGHTSYPLMPPFTNGNHTVALRACNTNGCGPSSVPFAFAYAVVNVPAQAPSNIRKR